MNAIAAASLKYSQGGESLLAAQQNAPPQFYGAGRGWKSLLFGAILIISLQQVIIDSQQVFAAFVGEYIKRGAGGGGELSGFGARAFDAH